MNFRTIDGSGNNIADPTMNAAGSAFGRMTDKVAFNPDINPRMISNVVVGQGDAEVENKKGLSELFTTWGQFLDHTLDLQGTAGSDISVVVPAGDQFFTPGSTIDVHRATVDASGEPINRVSSWVDASQVYGSNAAVANSLKAPDGMHLAVSEGNHQPIVDGKPVFGDVRGAENDYLRSVQEIFTREHNFQVDKALAANPSLAANPELVYQTAKAIVDAEIQDITYHEYLPHLLGNGAIKAYHGYNPNVDASVTAEFAGAAFRLGHSQVGPDIEKFDNAGNELESRSLADDFLDGNAAFLANGGDDATSSLLRSQVSGAGLELDARIVSELRNFLVDGGPRIDLASVNIRRGEDLGIDTLNGVREDLGLQPYKNFNSISTDKATVEALKVAYGNDINKVDLWVGGLAEKHVGGGEVGQTFRAILTKQFTDLRDGDRFWYENKNPDGPGFSPAQIKEITATSFADIIERNSTITGLQNDVFVADPLGPPPAQSVSLASNVAVTATAGAGTSFSFQTVQNGEAFNTVVSDPTATGGTFSFNVSNSGPIVFDHHFDLMA